MTYSAIDINKKFGLIREQWSPKAIAKVNGYLIKAVKIQGDFTWHKHDETDEIFIVHRGAMRIDFRDGHVDLKEGQLFSIEKGKEHKPYAENECEMLLIEPEGTLNTGDVRDEFTKDVVDWI
jgi:mannose-6-phosphate isomerase-like protein (cupin superfamily)